MRAVTGLAVLVLSAAGAMLAPPSFAASPDSASGESLFNRLKTGQLFNEQSCAACHQLASSTYAEPGAKGMVIRLGNALGAADPVYGAQVQTWSLVPHMAEAEPAIEWIEQSGQRVAKLGLYGLAYGQLAPETKMALRRAPSLAGTGLLAQIPVSEIVARAAEEAADPDGVRGKAAWLDTGKGGRVLGRFGWKATQPSIAAQTAAALSRDMGLSTTNFPNPGGDCTPAEKTCRTGAPGAVEGVAVKDSERDRIAAYVASIAAPKISPDIHGRALFQSAKCSACHATLHLKNGTPVEAYTDLLLHRMGDGLNDGIKEGAADAGEWRTAPLWDVRSSLKAGGLLHDGRARSVAEAIAWHGGEATPARSRYEALSAADKAALIAFVSGL